MKDLLEKLYKENQIWFVLCSLISADSLNCLNDYNNSIELLNKMENTIETECLDIPENDIEKIKNYITESKRILIQESKNLN